MVLEERDHTTVLHANKKDKQAQKDRCTNRARLYKHNTHIKQWVKPVNKLAM